MSRVRDTSLSPLTGCDNNMHARLINYIRIYLLRLIVPILKQSHGNHRQSKVVVYTSYTAHYTMGTVPEFDLKNQLVQCTMGCNLTKKLKK